MAVFEKIADETNKYLGSNVTHIANAYPETVTAIFHEKELKWEEICRTDGNGVIIEIHRETVDSWVQVSHGCVHQWKRNNAFDRLSIISAKGKKLVHNYGIRANHSVIIAKNGMIKAQNYGDNVWIDENGNDHEP